MDANDKILTIQKQLAEYDVTEREEQRGPAVYVRKGNRLVSIRTEGENKVRVTAHIDHGPAHDKTWVDGRSYKAVAGAVKFARQHLA